jgi:hypothetical protein
MFTSLAILFALDLALFVILAAVLVRAHRNASDRKRRRRRGELLRRRLQDDPT